MTYICDGEQNYFWVAEPEHNFVFKEKRHDTWIENTFTGYVHFELVTLQPIHIGSGKFRERNGELYMEFYNHNGKPIIPGSSIKGVIHHHLITLIGEDNTAVLFGVINKSRKLGHGKKSTEGRFPKSKSQASFVLFSDGKPVGNVNILGKRMPERWSPKKNPPYDCNVKYYKGNVSPESPKKEKIEVVPEDSKFNFRMSFRNLEDKEIGAILTAMGLHESYRHGIKIGGGKGYGLGLIWIDIDYQKSRIFSNPYQLLSLDESQSTLTPPMVKKFIDSFWESLSDSVKEHLAKIERMFSNEYKRTDKKGR